MSDYCSTPSEKLFIYIMVRTNYNRWDEMMMMMMMSTLHCTNTELEFDSASSLKQQSAGRYLASLSDILSRFQTDQYLLFLIKAACLAKNQQIPILESLVLLQPMIYCTGDEQCLTISITPTLRIRDLWHHISQHIDYNK